MATTQCSAPGCNNPAYCEVLLYDVYPDDGKIFMEGDFTCPFLCREHVAENEKSCEGTREPRGSCSYRYTNREGAQGFTIYRPLAKSEV